MRQRGCSPRCKRRRWWPRRIETRDAVPASRSGSGRITPQEPVLRAETHRRVRVGGQIAKEWLGIRLQRLGGLQQSQARGDVRVIGQSPQLRSRLQPLEVRQGVHRCAAALGPGGDELVLQPRDCTSVCQQLLEGAQHRDTDDGVDVLNPQDERLGQLRVLKVAEGPCSGVADIAAGVMTQQLAEKL